MNGRRLGARAVAAKDLNTAEIAYAAIEEVEKVQFINTIKSVPTEEGRSAELCLFRRRPEEAEAILLQAGLIFRAIETNVRLFNWDRALELAGACVHSFVLSILLNRSFPLFTRSYVCFVFLDHSLA